MRMQIHGIKNMRNQINDESKNSYMFPRKLPVVTCKIMWSHKLQ